MVKYRVHPFGRGARSPGPHCFAARRGRCETTRAGWANEGVVFSCQNARCATSSVASAHVNQYCPKGHWSEIQTLSNYLAKVKSRMRGRTKYWTFLADLRAFLKRKGCSKGAIFIAPFCPPLYGRLLWRRTAGNFRVARFTILPAHLSNRITSAQTKKLYVKPEMYENGNFEYRDSVKPYVKL